VNLPRRRTEEVAMSDGRRPWTAAEVPGQHGRTAVVTGASSGIGFETAMVLAQHGAATVLACRDASRGKEAADKIAAAVPEASVSVVRLDLASLASVTGAAAEIRSRCERLDLLINNAGVMMPPQGTTADGFELQFGTNHLGHFPLTGALLECLLPVPGSRVVTVSSNAHRLGSIGFSDLQWQRRRYRRMGAYGQSKLANLMFAFELQRRLAAAGAATIALAAHPGSSDTALSRHLPGIAQSMQGAMGAMFTQSAAMGALPTLRAATDPGARGGEYYGPDGPMNFKGYPVVVPSSARSRDVAAQRRLWEESERLSGTRFSV
jgi:NAD(P)-dependent dehydrogenase (short-subunit alcohol dehydrogenase family)